MSDQEYKTNNVFIYITFGIIITVGIAIGMFLGEVRVGKMLSEGKLGVICSKD